MKHTIYISILLIFFNQTIFCAKEPKYLLFHANSTENNEGGDLFKTLYAILYALHSFEEKKISGIDINFGQRGMNYTKDWGDNWWTYYFNEIHWGSPSSRAVRVPIYKQTIMYLRALFEMPTEMLHTLQSKYITLTPNLENEVINFCNKHFNKKRIVGLYYEKLPLRYLGNDLQPHVPHDKVISLLKKHCMPNQRIFLVTDDSKLKEKLHKLYGARLLTSPYAITKEKEEETACQSRRRLINCLLLARCEKLVKTSCIFSSCAQLFNPKLHMIPLDRNWLEKK